MCMRRFLLIGVSITLLFFLGCPVSRATLKTYVDPSIDPETIKSVAILPMRNVRLLPDEARELNRGVSLAFNEQNPNVKIVGPSEATDLLNQAQLADRYTDFLRDYATSGIPNTSILKQIGVALNTNAILQGEVFDIKQMDGRYGINKGLVSVTVRYCLISCDYGVVLWEATSNSIVETATTVESAPPLYEAVTLAQNKILSALPKLGGK